MHFTDHLAILSNWRTDKRQYFHRFLVTDICSQERFLVQDSLPKEFEELQNSESSGLNDRKIESQELLQFYSQRLTQEVEGKET